MPAYLRRDVYDVIRTRTNKVEVHHASLTDFLKRRSAHSIHRYVLLDAQDWMKPAQLTALVDRDRPHGGHARCAGHLPHGGRRFAPAAQAAGESLLAPWIYLEEESRAFHAKDRSSIYGGFHVYVRRPLS